MGGKSDSLARLGVAGLLLAVLAGLWIGLLLVYAVLGEEEEPMIGLLFLASVLTLFGSAVLTGAAQPYTPAAWAVMLLTALAMVATIGLLLTLGVQQVQARRKGK